MSSTTISQNLFMLNYEEYQIEYSKIPIDSVKFPDCLYISDLFNPLYNNTLILPVLVWKNGSHYIIVDGCKRYSQLCKNGVYDYTFAIINAPYDSTKSAALRINLNSARSLHLFEKLQYVKWLKQNCDSDCYRQSVYELGINDRDRFELEKLLNCSQFIIDALGKGIVDLQTASILHTMDEAGAQACLELFSKASFSRQQQRELIEWIPEISFSESVTINKLVNDNDVTSILINEKLNLPQKAQKIRDRIFQKRFPNLVKVKKIWAEYVNKLNPDPSKIHFSTTEAFEKNRLELRISLTEAENSVSLLKKLSEISKENWEKMIYPGSLL